MKMVFILLMTLGLTTTAMAQVKHLVFDIEGTIVQGIPKKNFDKFTHKSQMFSVAIGGAVRYFYIRPLILLMLNRLQKEPNYVIHFTTEYDQNWAQQVLSQVKLPAPVNQPLISLISNNSVNKLITREGLTNGKLDLRLFSSDTKNVLVFSSRADLVMSQYKANEIALPSYYYFESYSDAVAEYSFLQSKGYLASHAGKIPTSQEDWQNEQNKAAFIYHFLKEAQAVTTKDLLSSLGRIKLDLPTGVREGMKIAKFGFAEELPSYLYTSDKSKVLGCGMVKTETGELLRKVALDVCRKALSSTFDFKVDAESNRVLDCLELDPEYKAPMAVADMSNCLAGQAGEIKQYWKGEEKKECGSYYQARYFIAKLDQKSCGSDHLMEEAGEWIVKSLWPGIFPDKKVDLSIFNPSKSYQNGVLLPRNYTTLYRSFNPPQFDLLKGLRSLLGDNTLVLESKALSAVKLRLMGSVAPFAFDYSAYNYENRIANALAKNGGNYFNEREALPVAIAIVEEALLSLSKSEMRARYIDFSSLYYLDWPLEMMYGTIYAGVARVYGNMMIAFKDKSNRMADMTYINNAFQHPNDGGEYLMATYLTSSEMEGFFTIPLNEAFFVVEENKQRYLLAFQDYPCLYKADDDGKIYACPDKGLHGYALYEPMPDKSRPAQAMGVLALCSKKKACTLPKGFFKRHNVSSGAKKIRNDLKSISEGIKLSGRVPKVFYHEQAIDPQDLSTL